MTEFSEAVQQFSSEVDAAVNRARKASSDAAQRAEGFRAETARVAGQLRSGQRKQDRGDENGPAAQLRRAAAGYRTEKGLPVEDFPPPREEPVAPPQPERKSSVKQTWPTQPKREPELLGYDDDDFSQGSIFS